MAPRQAHSRIGKLGRVTAHPAFLVGLVASSMAQAGPMELFLDHRPEALALSAPPLPAAVTNRPTVEEPTSLTHLEEALLRTTLRAEPLYRKRLPDGTGEWLRGQGVAGDFLAPLGDENATWRVGYGQWSGRVRVGADQTGGSVVFDSPVQRQVVGLCARAGHRLTLGYAHEEFNAGGPIIERSVASRTTATLAEASLAWQRDAFELQHASGSYTVVGRWGNAGVEARGMLATSVGRVTSRPAFRLTDAGLRVIRADGSRRHFVSYDQVGGTVWDSAVLLAGLRVGEVDADSQRRVLLLGTCYGNDRRGGQVILAAQETRGELVGGASSGIVPELVESYVVEGAATVRSLGLHFGMIRPAGQFAVRGGTSATLGVVNGDARLAALSGLAGPERGVLDRHAQNAAFQLYTVSFGAQYCSGRLRASYGVAAFAPVASAELREFIFGPPGPPGPPARIDVPLVHALQVSWSF